MSESVKTISDPGLDQLAEMLNAPLLTALGDSRLVASIERLGTKKDVKDDALKLIVRDIKSSPTAVVLYSSLTSPHLVTRGMDIAEQTKLMLGDEEGSVILDPLGRGEIEGRSYAILPYCRPLSSRRSMHYIQRHLLRPGILRWLRNVTEETVKEIAPINIESKILRPLQHVEHLRTIEEEIRLACRHALYRLESRQWIPQCVFMHNDLWEGNILLKEREAQEKGFGNNYRFVLIDWAGAMLKGYAIYDLVRVSRSMGLKGRRFAREVHRHCKLLGCTQEDAMGYLLAAIGHIGLNPESFPVEAYARLTRLCFEQLRPAL